MHARVAAIDALAAAIRAKSPAPVADTPRANDLWRSGARADPDGNHPEAAVPECRKAAASRGAAPAPLASSPMCLAPAHRTLAVLVGVGGLLLTGSAAVVEQLFARLERPAFVTCLAAPQSIAVAKADIGTAEPVCMNGSRGLIR